MYQDLLQYAKTERQKEVVLSYIENEFNGRATARALGLAKSTVQDTIKAVKKYRENALYVSEGKESSGLIDAKEDKQFITNKVSTLYAADGSIKTQWVQSTVDKEQQLKALKECIADMAKEISGKYVSGVKPYIEDEDIMTMYITNDIHFGELMDANESLDRPWDSKIADKTVAQSFKYLVDSAPKSKYAMLADLGDLLTVNDHTPLTPKSGNIIDTDSRFSKILKTAYMALIRGIELMLTKHEIVYFNNISGNHDITGGHVVREIVSAWFRNEPRVIVNQSPSNIKYHVFGKCLFQFAHGDGMRMNRAGEAMAIDMKKEFGNSEFRYSHFGHTHKTVVVDHALTICESHRSVVALNPWASHMGFRGNVGTMKSICYHKDFGEISRNTFNVLMVEE